MIQLAVRRFVLTGPFSRLTSDRLLLHNSIMAASTIAAGLLGVAFQVAVTHRLPPAAYGEVFAVLSVVTLIGLPTGSISLLMARETSQDFAIGQSEASAALLKGGNRALLVMGMLLCTSLALTSPVIGGFLNVHASLLIAAAAGLPFGLASPLVLGELQGSQRFATLATLLTLQAAIKLAGALALGTFLGPVGIIAGVSAATSIVYLLAAWSARRRLSARARRARLVPALRYLAMLLPSTLSVSALLSIDLLLVKHYFPASDAGRYAAVVALARSVFYIATGIATVLFPKVVFREARGTSAAAVIVSSAALVVLAGCAALFGSSLVSHTLLSLFAGPAYAAAAPLLPSYSIAMTLFGVGSIFVTIYQSRGQARVLWVLVPVAILEPVAIVILHHSLGQVVAVVTASMGILAVALGLLLMVDRKRQGLAKTEGMGASASVSRYVTGAPDKYAYGKSN